MFLRRITLENIRSIERLALDFRAGDDSRRWTFILGDNGTGKSTILRSIALVLAGSDALPELLGSPRDWVRNGADEARVEVEIATVDGAERRAELTVRRDDTIATLYNRNTDLLGSLDRAFAHSTRTYFTVGYGVSRRPAEAPATLGRSQPGFKNPRARNVSTLFSPHATLASLEQWAMGVDYRDQAALPRIREAMDRLLPDVHFVDIDRKAGELVFDTPDGPLPYRLLSEGYQNVAAWTGDLLYNVTETFGDYRDPFAVRGLLLVDEIDLHLHPVWQRQLMAYIGDRFPNLQIVATTHSPLTVHQAGEGELFFLRRPAKRAPSVLLPYEGAPRNLMLHQLLLSPLFGLDSLDSVPVEEKKREYRELRDQRRRNRTQEKRFTELKDDLADLPDWSEPIEGQPEMTNLLRKVQSELSQR